MAVNRKVLFGIGGALLIPQIAIATPPSGIVSNVFPSEGRTAGALQQELTIKPGSEDVEDIIKAGEPRRVENDQPPCGAGTSVVHRGLDMRRAGSTSPLRIRQSSGAFISLYAVSFVDAGTGTAVGDRGTILRTTTGGE
jgi:hypothetical protein